VGTFDDLRRWDRRRPRLSVDGAAGRRLVADGVIRGDARAARSGRPAPGPLATLFLMAVADENENPVRGRDFGWQGGLPCETMKGGTSPPALVPCSALATAALTVQARHG